jgi:hypothetical protein
VPPGGLDFTLRSLAVLNLLLRFAFRCGVVGNAAIRRVLFAVRLSASQRTPQIAPSRITGIAQKEDPAMHASIQASPQIPSPPQHGPQHDVVLLHQLADLALATPIRTELEMLLNLNYDKPSVSLMMVMLFDTSLSYPIDAPVSRG